LWGPEKRQKRPVQVLAPLKKRFWVLSKRGARGGARGWMAEEKGNG